MWPAIIKGLMLFGFGHVPGGSHLYQELTRNLMGTQATHTDKLRRVWPTYIQVWQSRCGLHLENLDIWIHEAGWTPFVPLMNYLLTGNGGVATNVGAKMLDRYLSRAVDRVLTTYLPENLVPPERRYQIEAFRWYNRISEVVEAVGGKVFQGITVNKICLSTESIDLCHSGGVLEHYPREMLSDFLTECYRILRPGGVASHVFDHRDHLHHADHRWPFLSHLAFPDSIYNVLWKNTLNYHTLLLPTEIITLFEYAGFEPIAVRRMILPQKHYVEDDEIQKGIPGVSRSLVAKSFRNVSEADIRTAAAHYLFRKPR
jgi:SAM-dependent methyltransferase